MLNGLLRISIKGVKTPAGKYWVLYKCGWTLLASAAGSLFECGFGPYIIKYPTCCDIYSLAVIFLRHFKFLKTKIAI